MHAPILPLETWVAREELEYDGGKLGKSPAARERGGVSTGPPRGKRGRGSPACFYARSSWIKQGRTELVVVLYRRAVVRVLERGRRTRRVLVGEGLELSQALAPLDPPILRVAHTASIRRRQAAHPYS